MAKGGSARSWLRFRAAELNGTLRARVAWILRLTTVLLMVGHGALNLLVRKPVFVTQYGMLGLHGPWVEPMVGAFECVLALAVLFQPGFGLLLFVLAWKLGTEALSPMAGSPLWVFVEHGGSYAAPLGLALLLRSREVPVADLKRESPPSAVVNGSRCPQLRAVVLASS